MPELAEAVKDRSALFGTVDSWILYKLTNGKLHVTDASNASATGMYDPFTFSWAEWAQKLFKVPGHILPEVVDTAGDVGETHDKIFGISIPIKCSVRFFYYINASK